MNYSSPTIVGSRKTSGFGQRAGILHAGQDYAPPKPGQSGVGIYAVTSGTVTRAGFGNVLKYHSGNGVLIDHGVINGDKVESYYGHLASFRVRVGQKVSAGDLIGIMGTTGNSTGVHLHFGIILNGSKFIDPDAWLGRKGITVGKSRPLTPSKPVAPNKPTPVKPVTPNKQLTVVSIKDAQRKLKTAGYYKGLIDGKLGSMTTAAIRNYQKGQLFSNLFSDGVWGSKTLNHYNWVVGLQSKMNAWKGTKIAVDGDYGKATKNRVIEIMKANKGGAYKGVIDGIPGAMFCKMIGSPVHPK